MFAMPRIWINQLCVFALWPLLANLALAQERVVIRDGTVIDVRDGSLKPNTTVIIEGDRIVSVSPGAPGPGGTVIDAAGKYIIPGLIDSNVHYKHWAAELYLNNGVTTVFDLGSAFEWIRSQKEGTLAGWIPGPRIFHATNILDGPPKKEEDSFVSPYVQILKDEEQAAAAMRQYTAEGVDAVKVHDGLSADVLRALVREAKKAKIPTIGEFKDVRMAAAVGAQGIEHTEAVANAIVDENARQQAMKKVRKGLRIPAESFMDAKKVSEIVQLMVNNDLYLNPTLRMTWQGDHALRDKGFHYQDFELLLNNWDLRYIPIQWKLADLKQYQQIGLWNWTDLTPYERELFHQGYVNSGRLVNQFVNAGGKLYAGTNSGDSAVPGISMHQELQLLVDSGISPLQALQAATINPAELMHASKLLGAIEPGKAGDVVILDANPLQDIRNTQKIYKVIARGRILDGKYHADYSNPIPSIAWEDSSHFFPSPRIRSVAPDALAEETAASIAVRGSGFIPYSYVRWNGKRLKTEFVSETELKAEVPPELAKLGSYPITVENPDFGVGSIYASGATDIGHLGVRPPVSNELVILVKSKAVAPIFPHPQEPAAIPK